jgi:hypothetical protein
MHLVRSDEMNIKASIIEDTLKVYAANVRMPF